MDFNVGSARKRVLSSRPAGEAAEDAWGNRIGESTGRPCRLSFYEAVPAGDVSLEEFESFALDRLRVLKAVEEAKSRGKQHEEVDRVVSSAWHQNMRSANGAAAASRKDLISHHVLRLAYCHTEDLRRWFLAEETALFRHRFRIETPDNQKQFLEEVGLPYRAITSAEFESVRESLVQVARSTGQQMPSAESIFYKVPFEEVSDLVGSRRVFLKAGFAFVPREQLASIVVGHFRARLSKALIITNRHWTAKVADEEADRLTPIVEALSQRYLGPDYSQPTTKGHVAAGELDSLAQHSFPPCMRHLFFKLREEHHLRHGGRMQLSLFLKGIGVKLEDALAFWRGEFSRKVGPDRFDKEYAYGIRHNYGKEGKRTDYTPYSCMKVISSTPGVGDHHGCPFKHFSEENLRAMMHGMKLSGRESSEVVEKVRNHHYQLACSLVFESVHKSPCEVGINHPNQYYDQSRLVLEERSKRQAIPQA